MYVWRAGRLRDQLRIQQLRELARKELACVVGVEGADDAYRRGGFAARVGVHRRDERAHALGCFRLRLEEVDEFEASVVVDEYERVLISSKERRDERPHDVGVHEPPSVRGLVLRVPMW